MAVETPAQKPDLIRQIQNLSRRINLLERVNQLGQSAIQIGALRILDASNKLAAKIGLFSDAYPARGVFLYDEDGFLAAELSSEGDIAQMHLYDWTTGWRTVRIYTTPGAASLQVHEPNNPQPHFQIRDDGVVHPVYHLPAYRANDFVVVTSGTFVTTWQSSMSGCPAPALGFNTVVGCDPSTTGEVRLKITHSGGTLTTDTKSCAANTFTNFDVRWEHDLPLREAFNIDVEARRTSGAGNVNVYSGKTGFYFSGVAELGATAGGLV